MTLLGIELCLVDTMTDLSPFHLSVISKLRVTVLVDAGNFPHDQLASLEAEAAALGEITIRRSFGDATKAKGWPTEFRYAMLHCPTTINKKNLADMHLTVTAMDIAQRGLAQAFVIASNDRDFDPLAQHLVETGRSVRRVRRLLPTPPAQSNVVILSQLERQISDEIRSCPEKSGLLLTALNIQMRNGYKTKISETTEGSWYAYLTARPLLFSCDKRGADARVRLKQR